MGGSGAKNRRKELRLAKLTEVDSPSQQSLSNGRDSKTKKRPATKKKTTKVKKPKHLKRKIDALTEGGNDSEEKIKLIKELEQWQETKKSLQKQRTKIMRDNKKRPETTETLKSEVTWQKAATASKCSPSFANEMTNDHRQEEASNENDSDEEVVVEQFLSDKPVRQRGKRRRGRKDTSQKIQESNNEDNVTTEVHTTEVSHSNHNHNNANETPLSKRAKREDHDTRYCKGRKPVTDFVVGQEYTGKVVYAKPFGVFLDIGCHSDAFCHVSRVNDDYVASAESLFQPGDAVERVRVIEIDRANKRITVSLQSDAMREMELQSIEARQGRRNKRVDRKVRKVSQQPQRLKPTTVVAETSKDATLVNLSRVRVSNTSDRTLPSESSHSGMAQTGRPEAEMTPAELKRARKLARRAARRAEQEQANETKAAD